MKEPFDIFTVFEIKQSLKTATNFFDRFDSSNSIYTLAELAKLNEIPPALLATILLKFENTAKKDLNYDTADFDQFSIEHLLRYVEITHQFYRKERMKRIERIILNLEKETGGQTPFSELLYQSYIEFRQFLYSHLKQEEEILFPYAKSLLAFSFGVFKEEHFYLKSKLPECFLHLHNKETDFNLFRIFTLVPSQFYSVETTAELMKLEVELKSFEIDLEVHSWIEEEVLIPKIITLRKELFNQ